MGMSGIELAVVVGPVLRGWSERRFDTCRFGNRFGNGDTLAGRGVPAIRYRERLEPQPIFIAHPEDLAKCLNCLLCHLSGCRTGGRLDSSPVRTGDRVRCFPFELCELLLVCGGLELCALEIPVAHDLDDQRSVLEGQCLPEPVRPTCVVGDQYPPTRPIAQLIE